MAAPVRAGQCRSCFMRIVSGTQHRHWGPKHFFNSKESYKAFPAFSEWFDIFLAKWSVLGGIHPKKEDKVLGMPFLVSKNSMSAVKTPPPSASGGGGGVECASSAQPGWYHTSHWKSLLYACSWSHHCCTCRPLPRLTFDDGGGGDSDSGRGNGRDGGSRGNDDDDDVLHDVTRERPKSEVQVTCFFACSNNCGEGFVWDRIR